MVLLIGVSHSYAFLLHACMFYSPGAQTIRQWDITMYNMIIIKPQIYQIHV